MLRADNDGEGGILSLITLIRRRAVGGSARTKVDPRRARDLRRVPVLRRQHHHPGDLGALGRRGDQAGRARRSRRTSCRSPRSSSCCSSRPAVRHRAGGPALRPGDDPVVPRDRRPAGSAASSASRGCSRRCRPPTRSSFLVGDFTTAFFALAAVVLAITGAEALYADLGHFGRSPITRAWLVLVFPACILSYLGQGALILDDPKGAIASPFFLLVPDRLLVPMVVLATAATVIASQAVITGAFSVARQAVQLGYLPRLRILHTSAETQGQIYVPWINWVLMISVLVAGLRLRELGGARLRLRHGGDRRPSPSPPILFFYLVRHRWGTPLLAGRCWAPRCFLSVELLFLAANLTKIAARRLAAAADRPRRLHRADHLAARPRARSPGSARTTRGRCATSSSSSTRRSRRCRASPGTAVFLNRGKSTTPLAMRANVEHNRILHEHVVILSIETMPVPHVDDDDRIEVDDLGLRRRRDRPRQRPLRLHGDARRPGAARACATLQRRS